MNFSRMLFVIYAILSVLLFYSIFYSPEGLKKYLMYKGKYAELEMQIAKIRRENRNLLKKIRNFRNDRSFREFIVRDRLGWIKDGEKVIIPDPCIKSEKLEDPNELQ